MLVGHRNGIHFLFVQSTATHSHVLLPLFVQTRFKFVIDSRSPNSLLLLLHSLRARVTGETNPGIGWTNKGVAHCKHTRGKGDRDRGRVAKIHEDILRKPCAVK